MGRLEKSEQRTDGEVYPSEYKYNLAGALIEQKYPSGRVVKNMLDASGDISNISSRVHNGPFKNYASNFEYTAGGVIKHLQIGNGLWESAVMNSRNQVLELKMGNSPTNGGLMHLTYEYGEFDAGGNVDVTKNAGNIAKQTITFNGLANPFVQSYKYDSLDRITEAKETVNGGQTWIQTFGYDRYGNRTSHSETVGLQAKAINEVTLPAVDANTNKFSNTTNYEFDAVGNLVRDIHGRQFVFNGDNKQVEVRNSANQVVGEYKYDGLGKRIKKETATEYVVFVYDGLGKLIGEYSTDGPPQDPMVHYTATDPLGSPRVLTNENGAIISRRDFMPFGEEIAPDTNHRTATHKYGVGDGVRQKFTGYERDEETGLDFAEARYYYNNHGRFTAVDPLLASGKSADPQTFNRYAYTMNRPLILTDPTGLQSGTPKPSTKPEESFFDRLVQALGLPKPVYVDEPYERIPLGEPGLLDSLAGHATSAIVTFAENNGSELLLGSTDVEHTAAGRIIGDTASIVQGVAEVNLGLSMTVGGGAGTVATAPACATGVGCAAPAATATVSVSGVTVATHGAAVLSNTIYNQANRSDSGGGNSAKDYHPKGRSKIQTAEDAADQAKDLRERKKNADKGKGDAIIDSTRKSDDREIQKAIEEWRENKNKP